MTLYCKIVGGAVVAREQKDSPEIATGQDGNPVWRPFVANAAPSYDPTTHHPPVRSEVIEATQVVETWADPVAFTEQDISAQKDLQLNAVQVVALKVFLDHENRIRAIEGKQSVTLDQFKTALKAKL